MTANQKKLILDKTTAISLGVVIGFVGVVWVAATQWAQVQAQTNQNTQDVQELRQNLSDLNDNLYKLNDNVVRLNTILEKE